MAASAVLMMFFASSIRSCAYYTPQQADCQVKFQKKLKKCIISRRRRFGRFIQRGEYHRTARSVRTQCLCRFCNPHPPRLRRATLPRGRVQDAVTANTVPMLFLAHPSAGFADTFPSGEGKAESIRPIHRPPSVARSGDTFPPRGRQSSVDSPHPPLSRSPFHKMGKARVYGIWDNSNSLRRLPFFSQYANTVPLSFLQPSPGSAAPSHPPPGEGAGRGHCKHSAAVYYL